MSYADQRPAFVRIMGKKYAILYDLDSGDYGQFDAEEAEISIRDGVSPVEEADTVLHEILHAVWFNMDIGNKKIEEHVVRKLATGLTQVFQDNPALVQYLVDAGAHQ